MILSAGYFTICAIFFGSNSTKQVAQWFMSSRTYGESNVGQPSSDTASYISQKSDYENLN
jgi:hypothetical protein